MKSIFAVLGFILFVSISVWTYMGLLDAPAVEKDIKAKYLKGGEFTLSNEGNAFSLSSLKGQPVILYFGFTFCPDVCPVGLATIRDALNSSEQLSDIPALFITLDPERDTAQKLKDYTGFFHRNIIGLTGSLDEISAVTKTYGTYFKKSVKSDKPGDYLVDHTAYFYLIDKQGELLRVLDHDASASELSELLLKLL